MNSPTPKASDPVRNAELAAIHTARRQLALTEESYRSIVSRFSKARTESSGELTADERRQVIEYFRSIGFDRAKGGKAKSGTRTGMAPVLKSADYRPQAMKLRALWYGLYQLAVVRDPSQEALESFVRRRTRIEAMRWNHPADLNVAIECLKSWCQRVGYWPTPCKVPSAPQFDSFKPGLIDAQWDRLTKLGAFRTGVFARIDTWFAHQGWPVSSPIWLTDEQAETTIKRLGDWLRKLPASVADDPEEAGDG